LKKQGYDKSEIKIISEILIFAQLRNSNQGVVKLIGEGMPKDKNAKKIETKTETKINCLLNGNQNHGMIVLDKAVKIGLNKTRDNGISVVGTYNTSSSTGCLTYYATEITKKGFICFIFAGSPPSPSPFGSNQRLFGTNPICVGFPTKSDPIVLDMSTSSIAYYGLVEAITENKKYH